MFVHPSAQYYSLDRPEVAALVPVECHEILEIGCGFGALGRFLVERQGCVVDGVEINPAASDHLARSYRNYWIGDFERVDFSARGQTYDCILFPDVLEHLHDPWHAVARAASLLRSDGCLVLSVPNIRNLAILYRLIVQGRWDYEPSGILDRGHLRFFTRRSIENMLIAQGMNIETWHCNRDRYVGLRRLLAYILRPFIGDIDVCQFVVRARKS